MKYLWKKIAAGEYSEKKKKNLFLLFNTLLFAMLGFSVWLLAGRLVLPGLDWMLCFIGYPGYFIGYMGGYFYLYRID